MKYERYYGLLRKASFENWDSVKKSKICGCYYCGKIFPSSEIRENGIPPCDDGDWIQDKNGRTVLCPYCGIDSVYGDVSGIPINDEILAELHNKYFESDTDFGQLV